LATRHAVFDDALDAAVWPLAGGARRSRRQRLASSEGALRVTWGNVERRDNDYFGSAVTAPRIMGCRSRRQILLAGPLRPDGGEASLVGFLRDLGAVRLRDLARPERVYQVMHPELRQDFPALRSLESTPNNLPQQTTSFIGRESELAELRNLLPNTRLLTLVGAGGLGKTRLTLQLGAEMLDDFPDGVWCRVSIADAMVVLQTGHRCHARGTGPISGRGASRVRQRPAAASSSRQL
jgi:hypothetical protein